MAFQTPVSELLKTAKLVFMGVLVPVLFLLLAFLLSPYFLKSSDPYSKSEVLILELDEDVSRKAIKPLGSLFEKMVFDRVWVVSANTPSTDSSPISKENPSGVFSEHLVQLGIDKPRIIEIPIDKSQKRNERQRAIIKKVASESIKTILVASDAWKLSRVCATYKKSFENLGVSVSCYELSSPYSDFQWYRTESGIAHVAKELILFLYYKIQGYT